MSGFCGYPQDASPWFQPGFSQNRVGPVAAIAGSHMSRWAHRGMSITSTGQGRGWRGAPRPCPRDCRKLAGVTAGRDRHLTRPVGARRRCGLAAPDGAAPCASHPQSRAGHLHISGAPGSGVEDTDTLEAAQGQRRQQKSPSRSSARPVRRSRDVKHGFGESSRLGAGESTAWNDPHCSKCSELGSLRGIEGISSAAYHGAVAAFHQSHAPTAASPSAAPATGPGQVQRVTSSGRCLRAVPAPIAGDAE